MKLLQKLSIYGLAFVLLVVAGCAKPAQADPQNPLAGSWEDVYGLTSYEFLEDQHLKLRAMGVASFGGSYSIEEDQMTVTLSILGQNETHTYAFRMEDNRFFLNQTEFVRKS